MSRRSSKYDLRQGYPLRIMISLASTLLLLIAVFNLWPVPTADEEPLRYGTSVQERIQMEEVVPSSQTLERKPPPPAPLVPVVVPDDVVLEEVEIDLADDNFLPVPDPSDDDALAEGDPDGQPAAQTGIAHAAKPVRFVEPEYTRAARRKRIRAEVVVEVLVDERGQVQEARVLERYLIGDDDEPKRPVTELGYGLEEAALAAAKRWQFRPASLDGKPVPDQTTLTFFFGV